MGGKAGLHVGDHSAQSEPVLESGRIGQRLDGRARLAQRERGVHRAIDPRLEIVGTPDHGSDSAACGFHDDQGRIVHLVSGLVWPLPVELRQVPGHCLLGHLLQGEVERGVDAQAALTNDGLAKSLSELLPHQHAKVRRLDLKGTGGKV